MIINNPVFENISTPRNQDIDIKDKLKSLPKIHKYEPVVITGYEYSLDVYNIDKDVQDEISVVHETLVSDEYDMVLTELTEALSRREPAKISEFIKKAEIFTPEYMTQQVKELLCSRMHIDISSGNSTTNILTNYLRGGDKPKQMTIKFSSFLRTANLYRIMDGDENFTIKYIVDAYRPALCPEHVALTQKQALDYHIPRADYLDSATISKLKKIANSAPSVMKRLETEILSLIRTANNIHLEAGHQCDKIIGEFAKQLK